MTVNGLVVPAVNVKVAGVIAVTASGGGTTLITAEAVELPSAAVMPACPSASVITGTATAVWPAGTTT